MGGKKYNTMLDYRTVRNAHEYNSELKAREKKLEARTL
jgi:hypothetical protein